MLAAIQAEAPTDTRPRERWRCSQAGMCWRARWFHAKGYQPTNDLPFHVRLAMWAGTSWHRLIQRRWPVEAVEVPVSFAPDVPLDGTADLITDDRVIEIKSVADAGMSWLTNGGPPARHQLQASLYAAALGRQWIELVYVARAFGKLVQFVQPRVSVSAELNEVKRWDASENPPPRLDRWPEHWECRSCVFRTLCEQWRS